MPYSAGPGLHRPGGRREQARGRQPGDQVVQRRFAFRQLVTARLVVSACGGRDCGVHDGGQAVDGRGVAAVDRACECTRGLAEPVLQVRTGTADLLGDELGHLAQHVLADPPPAELAGQVTADRTGQQLGLAGVVGQDVEEPRILHEPSFLDRDGQVQVEQLGGVVADAGQLAVQRLGEAGVQGGQPFLQAAPPFVPPLLDRGVNQLDEALAAVPLDRRRVGESVADRTDLVAYGGCQVPGSVLGLLG